MNKLVHFPKNPVQNSLLDFKVFRKRKYYIQNFRLDLTLRS